MDAFQPACLFVCRLLITSSLPPLSLHDWAMRNVTSSLGKNNQDGRPERAEKAPLSAPRSNTAQRRSSVLDALPALIFTSRLLLNNLNAGAGKKPSLVACEQAAAFQNQISPFVYEADCRFYRNKKKRRRVRFDLLFFPAHKDVSLSRRAISVQSKVNMTSCRKAVAQHRARGRREGEHFCI